MSRALGYRPDPPKLGASRPDWDFSGLFKTFSTSPAPVADLRHLVAEVLDQGPLSSCVANAGMQAIRMAQTANLLGKAAGFPKLGCRLWGYVLARSYIDEVKKDEGSHIRDFFRGVNNFGFFPEDLWPYNPPEVFNLPVPRLYRAAFDQKDKGDTAYWRITASGQDRFNQIRAALYHSLPVVFGADVSYEFSAFSGFKVFGPPKSSEVVGGHAMTLVGHGLAGSNVYTAVGSWGSGYHDQGYHHFSQDYVDSFRDIWVVEKAPLYSE